MRIDIKTPRQETKETLKQLINNYHTIHPEKGYRAVRKDISNDTGWIVSSYLMYQCFREGASILKRVEERLEDQKVCLISFQT